MTKAVTAYLTDSQYKYLQILATARGKSVSALISDAVDVLTAPVEIAEAIRMVGSEEDTSTENQPKD